MSREMSKSGFVTLPSVTGSSRNIHSPQPPKGTSAVRLPRCPWPFVVRSITKGGCSGGEESRSSCLTPFHKRAGGTVGLEMGFSWVPPKEL